MRLGVALKNWPALRFWTRAGFDRIITVKGDEIFSESTSAFLVREEPLASPKRQP